jgi:hypothetical protein
MKKALRIEIARRRKKNAKRPARDYLGRRKFRSGSRTRNNFNGNYIDAEMVKAFLSSIEYRERFQGGASRGNPAMTSLSRNAVFSSESIARSLWISLPVSLVRGFMGG